MSTLILTIIGIFLAYSFIAIGYGIAGYQVNVFDNEKRDRQEVFMALVIASIFWPISLMIARDRDKGEEI